MLKFEQIFTIQNIIIYLIVINVIGFLVMKIDKTRAKKGEWRISEKAIFIITFLGGGIGTILGMYVFRHKTQKPIFKMGLPFILILEIVTVIWFLIKK